MFCCLYLIEVQSNNFPPTYRSANHMGSYYIFLGQLSGTVPYISITIKILNVVYLQFTGPRDNWPDPKCILIYSEDVAVS